MLIRFDFDQAANSGQHGLRIAYAADLTDVTYEEDRWWGVVDTALPSDRHAQVRTNFATLARLLASGDPAALTEQVAQQLFGGHFFAILADRMTGQVWLARDTAGAKSGYATWVGQQLLVGSCMHDVAQCMPAAKPSDEATRQVLAIDFLFDGQSYYSDIEEIPMGETRLILGPDATKRHVRALALPRSENQLPVAQNIAGLRRHIIEAHAKRAGSDNVVLLSGGIDSAVMLCSLVELAGRSGVRAKTFRVKGTEEDETTYARGIADHLGVECELIEVDPEDEHAFDDFERDVLRMNNPYCGRWIFGRFEANPSEVYFAGQDTRLHTPDINSVDKLAYALLGAQQTPGAGKLLAAIAAVAEVLGRAGMSTAQQRWVRGLYRAGLAFDLDRYLPRFFFKINYERLKAYGYPPELIEHVLDRLKVDWRGAQGQRDLYNRIVSVKWGEQYTDDMRYLQDMARMNGTYIALPFYDMALARFSAELPFSQSTQFMVGADKFSTSKKVLVNKFLLREAFRPQLNDELYFRAKAVSRSMYLMFTGALGRKIRGILGKAMSEDRAWLEAFGMVEAVRRFQSLTRYMPEDEEFLLKVYYLAVNYIIWSSRDYLPAARTWQDIRAHQPA